MFLVSRGQSHWDHGEHLIFFVVLLCVYSSSSCFEYICRYSHLYYSCMIFAGGSGPSMERTWQQHAPWDTLVSNGPRVIYSLQGLHRLQARSIVLVH